MGHYPSLRILYVADIFSEKIHMKESFYLTSAKKCATIPKHLKNNHTSYKISGENPHETRCYIGPKKDYYYR